LVGDCIFGFWGGGGSGMALGLGAGFAGECFSGECGGGGAGSLRALPPVGRSDRPLPGLGMPDTEEFLRRCVGAALVIVTSSAFCGDVDGLLAVGGLGSVRGGGISRRTGDAARIVA